VDAVLTQRTACGKATPVDRERFRQRGQNTFPKLDLRIPFVGISLAALLFRIIEILEKIIGVKALLVVCFIQICHHDKMTRTICDDMMIPEKQKLLARRYGQQTDLHCYPCVKIIYMPSELIVGREDVCNTRYRSIF
jgi:hypothetical protein